jgi:hypothetical protein
MSRATETHTSGEKTALGELAACILNLTDLAHNLVYDSRMLADHLDDMQRDVEQRNGDARLAWRVLELARELVQQLEALGEPGR